MAADLLTHNTLFTKQPLAVDMLIDILTDRGFFVAYVAEEQVRLAHCLSFAMHGAYLTALLQSVNWQMQPASQPAWQAAAAMELSMSAV